MAYATQQDLYDEGMPTEAQGGPTSANLLRWIQEAQEIIYSVTRNIFETVTGTFIFDGTNTHLLHLPIPIVSVTSLQVNGEAVDLDPSMYRVYNGRSLPQDDRRNPKIELRAPKSFTISSVLPLVSTEVFRKGYDQTITGTWGYVEPDNSVPILIRRATVGIVMTMAEQLYPQFSGARGFGVGPVTKEKTDDHELQWGTTIKDVGQYVLPTAIENLLLRFKAPKVVTSPTVRFDDLGWHRTFASEGEPRVVSNS